MSEPLTCPQCGRVFNWGADADSKICDDAGEQWIQCRENAHWKLTFHFLAEHPDKTFVCPRRAESFKEFGPDERDFWCGDPDGHDCSYCGSMSPDRLFEAIAAGHQVIPTDKNYKVYVVIPNPRAGQTVQMGSESGPAFDRDGKRTRADLTDEEVRAGRFSRPRYGTAPSTTHAKFYFQHLSADEQRRFIDLLNAKQINLGEPGHFYRLPFFAVRADKAEAAK